MCDISMLATCGRMMRATHEMRLRGPQRSRGNRDMPDLYHTHMIDRRSYTNMLDYPLDDGRLRRSLGRLSTHAVLRSVPNAGGPDVQK